MINSKRLIKLLLLCTFCFVAAGCWSTRHIDKKQYLFNIDKLTVSKKNNPSCSVYTHHLTALTPFDNVNFIYRVGPSQYQVDYYHSFLTSPTQQIEPILFGYFKSLGNFLPVTTYEANIAVLTPQLTQCYADYRDTNHPRAVLALHLMLKKQDKNKVIVLMDKNFRIAEPIAAKDTDSLMAAWNRGLEDLSIEASKNVRTALAKAG